MQIQQFLMQNAAAALGFAAALACGFMGCRLQKPLAALVVLFAGYFLFQRIGLKFLPSGDAAMGFAIVAAVLAAALSYQIYLAGIFAAMVALGAWTGRMWIANGWIGLLAGTAIGCVLGLLAIKNNRPLVIVVTGVAGGFGAADHGARLFMALFSMDAPSGAGLMAAGAVLAAAGIAVQFRTTREITSQ